MESKPTKVRVAQYNIVDLGTDKLSDPNNEQVKAALEVVNRISPDFLAVHEIQYDLSENVDAKPGDFDNGALNGERLAALLNQNNSGKPYRYSLLTLGNWGFYWPGYIPGVHWAFFASNGDPARPGGLNSALISRYPILEDKVRVIADFAWRDLPDNVLADLKADTGDEVPEGFPLFNKALIVAPVDVGGTLIYAILLHTTSPIGFRINKYRNRDQIKGLALFLEGKLPGVEPLPENARFVVLGDLNCDPEDGDGLPDTAALFLNHPLIAAFNPSGAGTVGTNPAQNTHSSACMAPDGPDPETKKQLRLDYVLPSLTIGTPLDGAVFFPDFRTAADDWKLACMASDHMLVWADLPL